MRQDPHLGGPVVRVRVVLQSRLSSSRLPGKAMLMVGGMPMVVLAALRAAQHSALSPEVVVATSDRAEDDMIAEVVGAITGVHVVRGPLEDPLARFALAADEIGGAGSDTHSGLTRLDDDDVVVRLTGDNVVPDGSLVDAMAAELESRAVGFVRFGGDDPTVPYGVAGEAFTAGGLRTVAAEAVSSYDREHVTPMLRRRYGDHRFALPDLDPRWAGQRCTVDTFDDYVKVAGLFAGLEDPVGTPWREVCARLEARSPGPAPWPVSGGARARSENPIGQGALVLGTVQLGVEYGAANSSGMPAPATAGDVLSVAAMEGVTHLDTARAYGDSERRVGAALARGLSERVGVVTKVRPLDDVDGSGPAGWGRAAVGESVAQSLGALRVDRVDALLLHRAADLARPGVREALHALRDEGTARLVGASLSTPEELVALLADELVGYVQVPLHLLDRRWEGPEVRDALARRPEVVVTARSAYLQGLLVAPHATWPAGAGVDADAVRRGIAELVEELGRGSAADLCLAYVRGHEWVNSVVVGAETPDQVRENARLARQTPLDPDQLARVREVLPSGSRELVDPSRWR